MDSRSSHFYSYNTFVFSVLQLLCCIIVTTVYIYVLDDSSGLIFVLVIIRVVWTVVWCGWNTIRLGDLQILHMIHSTSFHFWECYLFLHLDDCYKTKSCSE